MFSDFAHFPKLPFELRAKIWRAAQEPRIVEVCQLEEDNHDSETIVESRNDADIQNEVEDQSDAENDDDDDSDEDSDWDRPNNNPFYSPTELPIFLPACRESTKITFQDYRPSFPHGPHPPQIHFNPSLDTLFFPAWCWLDNIRDFENSLTQAMTDTIESIAIEALMWYVGWEDGTINNQVRLFKFRNLRELVLVFRLPDDLGCGCGHHFDGPELGKVNFAEHEFVERWALDCKKEFKNIKERDPGWTEPEVKFVNLLRDGKFV